VSCTCHTARKYTDSQTEGVVKHCSVRQGMRSSGQVQITELDLSKVMWTPNLAFDEAVGMVAATSYFIRSQA
jgi:hypothetical protein